MPLIDTPATTLNYRFDGPAEGPVVMLAHSLAADLSMWDPQIAPLTSAGYRVLRYDHRGHGHSAVPPGPYTMADLTDDAVGLMDALNLPKVHFCGLSMGGMVGQMLGARHGERLHSLVLCSTAAHMPARDIWEERIRTVREQGMAAVAPGTLERWFTPAGRERLPETVRKIRKIIENSPAEGFSACCAALRDMDLRDILFDIDRPTLILVGEQDQGTPVAAARFIHERIPVSRLVVIAEAAHLQNIEQAETFNRTLREFFTEPA
ncbi:MAG: hypothetical protein VR64_10570 [Desulfatitalea sp. BRH_c12]|nr:MAG: hypothetical protein VR64_10570 [Desulfatitalea sp. BRH_c12]